MKLPIADESHFRDRTQYQPNGQLQRRIDDPELLDQLVRHRMALIVDVRRGRQPQTKIIQLRPSLDTPAPKKTRKQTSLQLQTVEDLRTAVSMILSRESQAVQTDGTSQVVDELRRGLMATDDHEQILALASKLREMLAAQRSTRQRIRNRIFAELSADPALRFVLTCISTVVNEVAPEDKRAQLRAESQRIWDERLTSVLDENWKSSRSIAAQLGANHETVKERLRDLLKRNGVERLITTQSKSTSRKRHVRSSGDTVSLYRLRPRP